MSTTKKLAEELHNIVLVGLKKTIGNNQVAINIRGTGFLVKDGSNQYIITCSHVYQEIPESERGSMFCGIISPDTKDSDDVKKYDFIDIKFNKKHPDNRRDICIFSIINPPDKIKEYGYNKADLATEEEITKLKVLQEIEFNGFPLANEFMQMGMGVTLAASKTVISAIKYSSMDKKVDFILIDKLINPGSSGSPVFQNGKIIGIASGTLNQTTRIGETMINVPVNIGMVKTSNYILELLDSGENK